MKKLFVIPLLLLTASCAPYYPYYAGNYYAAYPGYGYYQAPLLLRELRALWLRLLSVFWV